VFFFFFWPEQTFAFESCLINKDTGGGTNKTPKTDHPVFLLPKDYANRFAQLPTFPKLLKLAYKPLILQAFQFVTQ